jgi:hypothetical protein
MDIQRKRKNSIVLQNRRPAPEPCDAIAQTGWSRADAARAMAGGA